MLLHNEGNLFDESAFKRKKNLINDTRIPASNNVGCYDITYFVDVSLAIVGSKDSITILPKNPVVIPNIDRLATTNLPTVAFFNDVNGLIDTLPSKTGISGWGSMENVTVGVVFTF
jgi:hypothetical protein